MATLSFVQFDLKCLFTHVDLNGEDGGFEP